LGYKKKFEANRRNIKKLMDAARKDLVGEIPVMELGEPNTDDLAGYYCFPNFKSKPNARELMR